MLDDSSSSRYIVGIDLGTTTCSLAYIDTESTDQSPQILPIKQYETPQTQIEDTVLPSFCYVPTKREKLPRLTVGRLARAQATLTPGRVVHAAKSWLCHSMVDRQQKILPWHSDEILGDERVSPVEASAAYLGHLRDMWNERFGEFPLEAQQVTITVPASFDEVASELTLKAAETAGLSRERLRLLEEPQAAFYSSVRTLPQGVVLVCDIGGGTTDFSLLEANAEGAKRVAVSDHILLGGDNIDLRIAYELERKYGTKFRSRPWAQLVFQARALKERALSSTEQTGDESYHVSVAMEGAQLFKNTVSLTITKNEIRTLVLEGFFPMVERDARPRGTESALREWGLPYASDSAVTRHLAAFLQGRRVDAILFTGGTLIPTFVQERLREQVQHWQGGEAPALLPNADLELAVALGAAVYGAALRSNQNRIAGGYPRSLYVEVARPLGQAALVCLVPKGFSGDAPITIQDLGLKAILGQPVSFRLYYANDRESQPGEILPPDRRSFHLLAPMQTSLQAQGEGKKHRGKLVDVALEISLSETGLLALYLVGEGRWQLHFNVQAAGRLGSTRVQDELEPAASGQLASRALSAARQRIEQVYGKPSPKAEDVVPARLLRELEQTLTCEKATWDIALLRALWDSVKLGATRRGRSETHESAWFNLAGFVLRPGYGDSLDRFRVNELWPLFTQGRAFPASKQVLDQWWIFWRRIAGGLDKTQQDKIFAKLFPNFRSRQLSPEMIMLAGSLERIDMNQKIRLGNLLVEDIQAGRPTYLEQKIWALARIASRQPLYGGPQVIVRPAVIQEWSSKLSDLRGKTASLLKSFYLQAGRVVNDREFDLDADLRQHFLSRLRDLHVFEEEIRVVREYVPFDQGSFDRLFGEGLPPGLVLDS